MPESAGQRSYVNLRAGPRRPASAARREADVLTELLSVLVPVGTGVVMRVLFDIAINMTPPLVASPWEG